MILMEKVKNIIIYDFDGTLTPYKLTKFQILERCGLPEGAFNPKFLEMVERKAKDENIDVYTATQSVFLELIRNANLPLTDESFSLGANNIDYNKGVEEFLMFLKDNNIHNYLLSSGLKSYLGKTIIANYFDKIYATTFTYNNNGEATGIDYLMNDKNKVKAIKEILKMHGKQETDCRNVIYIGDGFTDYYAMEYVKRNKGTSIFVYRDKENDELKRLEDKDIISYSTFADFSYNSDLTNYIKKLCIRKKK